MPPKPMPFNRLALSPYLLLLLLGGVSAGLLVAAMGLAAIYDLTPCRLCIWQRYPHIGVVAIALSGLLIPRPMKPRLIPFLLLLAILGMLLTAGLGFWHAGIEAGLWVWSGECANVPNFAGDAEAVLDSLLDTKPIACDTVAWRLFGISMAGWNGLVSITAPMLALLVLRKYRQRH